MNNDTMSALHVLVVDDSAVVREVMSSVLSQERGIIVTSAADPIIAMTKMARQRPDVIILDLEMPRMGGLAFLRKIMSETPIPVVVCSAHVGEETALGLEALEEGAVDVVGKPNLGVREFLHESAVLLIDAVRAAAKSNVKLRLPVSDLGARILSADVVLPAKAAVVPALNSERIVTIGASTGGTEALKLLLEALPEDVPGVLVVQHMPEGFTAAFAKRLSKSCRIHVKEAAQGDTIVNGRALIAPGNRHTLVRRAGSGYCIEVVDGPLVSRHRPSIDVLFRSVAQVAGPSAVGVILTGMGSDGVQGLLEMKQAGALTIAQDEETCVAFGMSKEAIDRGAVSSIAALEQIPSIVLNALNGGRVATVNTR
ncbi:MAG: chemotaxis response regulator protein-glutamate methylesterase [Deltaproteobacteria bacterium]|nr:chemotaxis response regulator protein-glutamate methylesterase [Deltaproteobacteria bacterium]